MSAKIAAESLAEPRPKEAFSDRFATETNELQ